MEEQKGWSADGYIIDQDYFGDRRYRTMQASINGCGPMAAFNLLRFLGRDLPLDAILEDMDRRHWLHAPGPTSVRVMRAFLQEQVPEIREAAGREAALQLARESRAGIFRYQEGRVPHFISFIREKEGDCRFFNVADGLEDCRMSLEQFGAEHLKGGLVIVFAVPGLS